MLARLGLRSGAPMDKIVENLHVLPSYLVAIQDYKAKPSKVTLFTAHLVSHPDYCDAQL